MSTEIKDLQAAIQSYQQRLNEQREEIRKLTEEIARMGSNKDFATREDFKHLADKIREVDERRIAGDKDTQEKVAAEIARLGKLLTVVPPKTNTPAVPANPTPPAGLKTGSDKGYEYTVRQNDNPHAISLALAKKGVKVTAQQIIDANPTVAWTKLRIGQKLFIPASAPQ